MCLESGETHILLEFLAYFCYYSMGPIALFGAIHESQCTIQLAFSYFYRTFSKKISVLSK